MREKLTPEVVLYAYSLGAFPMGEPEGDIGWYSPDPRCIFPLETFKAARSVRQMIRRGTFDVRINSAYEQVMAACADRGEGTWISAEITAVYTQLHRMGFAHSVECWHAGQLAGGLYGVAIGGAFFGESMFTRVTNASKVALVALVERLRERGFTLLDAQWKTPHLERLGAIEIARSAYLRRLHDALLIRTRFADDEHRLPGSCRNPW